MKLYGTEIAPDELRKRVGLLAQVGGITNVSYENGRGRGVRAVRIDTGAMQVEVIADRCLDVAHVRIAGTPLMWRTPNDIAAPEYYDPNGDGWLRSFFGGWLTTCGLSNFGPAGTDSYGSFGLHGRIDNTPADELSATTSWTATGCVFTVSGVMRETKALGEVLALYRTMTTELGSTTLRIRDRVVNEGAATTPHMLLYHCNAGWPLVDVATEVFVSQTSMEPRDADAQAGLAEWNRGGAPQPQFAEQVFIHEPAACDDGLARAAIVNRAVGGAGPIGGASADKPAGTTNALGFEVAYDARTLPALMTWRKLEFGSYVLAVEPANTRAIQGREYAGRHGLLPFLEPGESRDYVVDLTALAGDRIDETIAKIASATAASATTR